MAERNIQMAPSPRHTGVQRISGLPSSISAASSGVRVDTPRGGNTGSAQARASPGGSASFTIHFSNIRGLRSNFSSVEQHLATSLPNLLLLTETQLSSEASSDLYKISLYGIISRFRSKGGICAYYDNNTDSWTLNLLTLMFFGFVSSFLLNTFSYAFVTFPLTSHTSPHSLLI